MGIEATFIPGTEFLFDSTLRYKVLAGGRGSGKSWSVARTLIIMACQREIRVLCVRELQKSLAESVHKLLADQIVALGLTSFFDVQRDGIYGKNGSQFTFQGIRTNPDSVKSTEGCDFAWVEEAQTISEESWQILDPTIRKPGSQIFVVYNPRFKSDYIHKLFADPGARPPGTIYKTLNYADNPFFPEALVPQREHMRATQPLMFKHVWLGECVPNLTSALWTWDSIDANRLPIGTKATFARVVIGVDPAVTAHKKSDETGIIAAACAQGNPRHYYVLSDVSGRLSPEGWASRAIRVYDEMEADAVIAEANQGWDMVASTIKNACQGRAVPRISLVHASRGKVVRAEPIAALYEQGLVHHIGYFPVLESQMMEFNPADPNQQSPDHLDALVWALTELSAGRAPMKIAQNALSMLLGTNLAARR